MIKNVLTSMSDIHVYPILSLILFVLVFAGAVVRAVTMRKSEAAALCRMPLEDSNESTEGEIRHD